jgi:hypothetical protein
MKHSIDTIWDRTSDLLISSTVPYPLCCRGPRILLYDSFKIFCVADYVASSSWDIMQCELNGVWKAVIVDCLKIKKKKKIHFAL